MLALSQLDAASHVFISLFLTGHWDSIYQFAPLLCAWQQESSVKVSGKLMLYAYKGILQRFFLPLSALDSSPRVCEALY